MPRLTLITGLRSGCERRSARGTEKSRRMGGGSAPLSDPDWITAAMTIRRAPNDCLEHVDKPIAIVVGPDVASLFRGWGGGRWSYGRPELFGLPVRIDRSAEGWSVRLKSEAGQGRG